MLWLTVFRIHVFADLQPYICTFSTCADALVQFRTRKVWADHEFDVHRIRRTWACPDCAVESSSPGTWDEHLRQEHGIIFSGPQHSIALASAQRIMPNPIDEQKCPICKIIPGMTQRAFSTHVGGHMEQIALAVLPRETDDDDEESSVATDLPIHDQRKETNPSPDLTPPLSASGGSIDQPEESLLDDSGSHPFGEMGNQQKASPFTSTDTIGSIKMTGPFPNLEKVETGDQTGSVTGHADKDRFWKCDQCPLRFSRDFDLQRHKKVHLGIKPSRTKLFHCPGCNMSFGRQDWLVVCLIVFYIIECVLIRIQRHIGNKDCPSFILNEVKDYLVDLEPETKTYNIKCFCANEMDDGNTVLCEGCDTWQHIKCYYSYDKKVPDVHNCTDCLPRVISTGNPIEGKCSIEDESIRVSLHKMADTDIVTKLSATVRETYVTIIDSILAASDLNTISERRIRKRLQETVGYDVTHHKVRSGRAEIRSILLTGFLL